jgi:hypothetical protein
MSYESITVNSNLRGRYIEELIKSVPSVGNEVLMQELMGYNGPIGIPNSGAPKPLEKYFDKLLPKTAGGLWHEMLVFIFLLRKDYGYVVPLLLSQRLYSLKAHLVPPDFLILTHDKRLYGIEVGMKKEIQSGSFSLRTAIPTATLDTINSRNSDRCPKCKKWILFCPYVISKYSDMNAKLEETEVNCLSKCTVYTREQILNGECKYTKYSRKYAKTLVHTHHDFADGLHYHYHCVLSSVDDSMHALLKAGEDVHSLKTHFPYYSGLEGLHGARIENGDVEENESDSSDLSL